jgi:hypothetical protein
MEALLYPRGDFESLAIVGREERGNAHHIRFAFANFGFDVIE